MSSAPRAVVLDFDGVVLQSVDLKTNAYRALFTNEAPEAVRRILEYHLANGGISRFEKFRWAHREVLKRPLSPERERELGDSFNALVEEAVVAAEWVPGAREFIEEMRGVLPVFVASGTPEDELRRIVDRRGMSGLFAGVFGSPPKKPEILRRIARSAGAQPAELVMVGDSLNDFDAADAAGTRFVGVVAPGTRSLFPGSAAVLPDLTGLRALLGL